MKRKFSTLDSQMLFVGFTFANWPHKNKTAILNK
jgi:hypothetical protein